MSGPEGVVYLLHLDKPLAHARHYLGFCEKYENLDSRFAYHASGRGSKLLAAASVAGISFRLVRLWKGTRDDERALKNCKGAAPYCPVCSGRKRKRRGLVELVI